MAKRKAILELEKLEEWADKVISTDSDDFISRKAHIEKAIADYQQQPWYQRCWLWWRTPISQAFQLQTAYEVKTILSNHQSNADNIKSRLLAKAVDAGLFSLSSWRIGYAGLFAKREWRLYCDRNVNETNPFFYPQKNNTQIASNSSSQLRQTLLQERVTKIEDAFKQNSHQQKQTKRRIEQLEKRIFGLFFAIKPTIISQRVKRRIGS
jgi:hypothetical protein